MHAVTATEPIVAYESKFRGGYQVYGKSWVWLLPSTVCPYCILCAAVRTSFCSDRLSAGQGPSLTTNPAFTFLYSRSIFVIVGIASAAGVWVRIERPVRQHFVPNLVIVNCASTLGLRNLRVGGYITHVTRKTNCCT